MIANLTVEAIVFEAPTLKLAPNNTEYLSVLLGMFDIKESGPQTFSKLECTLWSNPNLAKRIMEMDLQPRDRVLVNGKFTIKKIYGRQKLRLYIYDLTLLSRTTASTKNTEHEIINIDDSILNSVEVFDTTPVKLKDAQDIGGKPEEIDNGEW